MNYLFDKSKDHKSKCTCDQRWAKIQYHHLFNPSRLKMAYSFFSICTIKTIKLITATSPDSLKKTCDFKRFWMRRNLTNAAILLPQIQTYTCLLVNLALNSIHKASLSSCLTTPRRLISSFTQNVWQMTAFYRCWTVTKIATSSCGNIISVCFTFVRVHTCLPHKKYTGIRF